MPITMISVLVWPKRSAPSIIRRTHPSSGPPSATAARAPSNRLFISSPGPVPTAPPEVLVHQNVQRAFHRRWLRRMVAEDVGDQLLMFRDSPLVQGLGL